MSDYRYPAVTALAAVYLPRNRQEQARIVDNMLASRDTHIDQLKQDWRKAEDQVVAGKREIEQLREFIGRMRSTIDDVYELPAGASADRVLDVIERALDLPVPGAGAKSKGPPRYREFRSRFLLCADCDRPEICAVVRKGTAPCGKNELVSIECLEVKR